MRPLLARVRTPLLMLTAVATVLLAIPAAQVGIEHDNQSLNAVDPMRDESERRFRQTLGNDDDLLLAITHPQLLESNGLSLLDSVSAAARAIDGVAEAWSLSTVDELVHGHAGAEPRRLLAPPWPPANVVAETLDRNPDFTGWLVSRDRRTAAVLVQLEHRPDDHAFRARVIAELRELQRIHTSSEQNVHLHLTGVPVQKHDVSASVDRDQRLLLPLAIVVLGFTLAGFFRNAAGVVLPLAVAGLTVAWTMGVLGATGYDTNAITSLLPPVLLVVALAPTVHVFEAWRSLPAGISDPIARATGAVAAILTPAALCAITTAQGFASLATNTIPGVQQFGLFAAFGTLVAFVLSMGVVPALLSWRTPPTRVDEGPHPLTIAMLDRAATIATEHPKSVLATFGAITFVATLGIPLIRPNTDLIAFLRPDAPLRRDTEYIDQHLTGTLPLDFVIRRRDDRPLTTRDAFVRLETLEEAIRTRPGVTTVTSAVAFVRQVHRAETDGTSLVLPPDDPSLRNALDLLDESGHGLVRRFADAGFHTLRLSVRVRAIGTSESAPLIEGMLADAQRILGPDLVCSPTGALHNIIHDSTELVRQQVTSFGTAIVLIVAAIGLLFRSWTFTVVALIPNVMPILWTGGLMGYAGIDLSTGTAMIASAVLGLVVDDTIHYLSHYRKVDSGDAIAAVHATTRAVGAPVTVTSASLVLGFWVGAFGSFQPTVYFSLLTGLTMITGVVCDLLVLPASLVLLDRRSKRRRRVAT